MPIDRRTFLKLMAALATVPYLPALPQAEEGGFFISVDAVRRAAKAAFGVRDGWYVVMHPTALDDILAMCTPKERWKFFYGQERMRLKGMMKEAMMSGEPGSVEDFRFIVTDKVV